MPRDGNLYRLEDNTFVKKKDDGVKLYKTKNNHPDGPDSMQVMISAKEFAGLAAFVNEQIGVSGPIVKPPITTSGSTRGRKPAATAESSTGSARAAQATTKPVATKKPAATKKKG